ncbi:MAG: hypothetical protein DRH26_04215 [Deltaproteobacteria bacterium]|nr:MAG: hypothetical protein DRH26_04215 [Deltaproteobacteria bacterium]
MLRDIVVSTYKAIRAKFIPTGAITATNVQGAIEQLEGIAATSTTHNSSDGSGHTFIDQSVVSGASPNFNGENITGVDPAGTDNSTDVTLHASATTGGMSLSGQEISNQAATNAQAGYATAAHITTLELVDQDVTAGASPSFNGENITGGTDYTHPTHTARSPSGDTGALSGTTVISDLDFNITVDELGHVTDAAISSIGTRSLTLANFGINATVAEINKIDGFIGDATDLNYAKSLYDTGVTAAEFDYLDGVNNPIQTQLNGKLSTSGTAAQATSLATAQNFDITGGITCSAVSFNGTSPVNLVATINDDSHNHIISNVDGLQTAIDNAGGYEAGDPLNMDDQLLTRAMLKDCGYSVYSAGSGGSKTFYYTNGSVQTYYLTSSATLSVSSWPPSGNLGELLIIGTNFGSSSVTFSNVTWLLPDGTTTTNINTYLSTVGRGSFQSSGTDQILLWTTTAGSTIYGKVI